MDQLMQQATHNRDLWVDRDVLIFVIAHPFQMRAIIRDQRGLVDPAPLPLLQEFRDQARRLHSRPVTRETIFTTAHRLRPTPTRLMTPINIVTNAISKLSTYAPFRFGAATV